MLSIRIGPQPAARQTFRMRFPPSPRTFRRQEAKTRWRSTRLMIMEAIWQLRCVCLASVSAARRGWKRRLPPIAPYLREGSGISAPLDWAKAQDDLGDALSGLGKRESGAGQLKEAAVAFARALEVYAQRPGSVSTGPRRRASSARCSRRLAGKKTGAAFTGGAGGCRVRRGASATEIADHVPLVWARTRPISATRC